MMARVIPYGNALIFAIVGGAVLANMVTVPEWLTPGINLHTRFLEAGIILLGAQLNLHEVMAAGPEIILLAFGTVIAGLLLVEFLSRQLFGLPSRTSSLLAAGSSICGVSAVVAVAGSINARQEEIAYAAGTILVLDAITILTFPFLGELLELPGKLFGLWAGLSMFSTGPVAAAGFAYSDTAGQWATMTKLVRNSFIGIAVISYSILYSVENAPDRRLKSFYELWAGFPKFIIGFLLLMVVANLGVLPTTFVTSLELGSEWLFLLAFAGLGFDIRVSEMQSAGIKPLLTVVLYLIIISSLTLTVVSLVV